MSFKQNLKVITLSLTITPLVLLFAQCTIGNPLPLLAGKKIWLNDNKDRLTQEVRRHVAVGSSIGEAKDLLQFNGFQCSYHKTSEDVTVIETNRTSKDGDYLFCFLEKSGLVCATTYKPFIYYKNDSVTSVDAAIGGWCL